MTGLINLRLGEVLLATQQCFGLAVQRTLAVLAFAGTLQCGGLHADLCASDFFFFASLKLFRANSNLLPLELSGFFVSRCFFPQLVDFLLESQATFSSGNLSIGLHPIGTAQAGGCRPLAP